MVRSPGACWATTTATATRPKLVVDGRTISWEELATALEPYEGWGFRLVIEDRVGDVRSDAEIIELHDPGPGTGSDDA